MRDLRSFSKIFLYNSRIDFRKSINGLVQIVKYELELNPLEEGLFVFVARNRCAIKILYFDLSGFALWYKRLEKEKFKMPKPNNEKHILSSHELYMILNGYDVFKSRPHQTLSNTFIF